MTNPAFARGSTQRFGRARGPVPVAAPPSPNTGDDPAPADDPTQEPISGLDPADDTSDAPTPAAPTSAAVADSEPIPVTTPTGATDAPADPIPDAAPVESDTVDTVPADDTVQAPPAPPAPDTSASARTPGTKRPTKTAKSPKKKDPSPVPDGLPLVVISGGVVETAGPVHVLDLDNAADLDDYDILELVRDLRAVTDSTLKTNTVKALMEVLEQKLLTGA